MKNIFKNAYDNILDFIYPPICVACDKQISDNESAICTSCLWDLPILHASDKYLEEVKLKFTGRSKIDGIQSYLRFEKKGSVQNILHALKYKNQPTLAYELGLKFAKKMTDENVEITVDYLLPVPIHSSRLKERGYNQAEKFAEGISEILNIPLLKNQIKRINPSISQTKTTSRIERYNNIRSAYELETNALDIKSKSVAIVDDVLTTGATVEVLSQICIENGVKNVYIFTIALA